jgi:hypothetical protein
MYAGARLAGTAERFATPPPPPPIGPAHFSQGRDRFPGLWLDRLYPWLLRDVRQGKIIFVGSGTLRMVYGLTV